LRATLIVVLQQGQAAKLVLWNTQQNINVDAVDCWGTWHIGR
jgi:hypothetical protein